MKVVRTFLRFLAIAALSDLDLAQPTSSDLNCLIQPHVVITITTSIGGLLETVTVDRGDLESMRKRR